MNNIHLNIPNNNSTNMFNNTSHSNYPNYFNLTCPNYPTYTQTNCVSPHKQKLKNSSSAYNTLCSYSNLNSNSTNYQTAINSSPPTTVDSKTNYNVQHQDISFCNNNRNIISNKSINRHHSESLPSKNNHSITTSNTSATSNNVSKQDKNSNIYITPEIFDDSNSKISSLNIHEILNDKSTNDKKITTNSKYDRKRFPSISDSISAKIQYPIPTETLPYSTVKVENNQFNSNIKTSQNLKMNNIVCDKELFTKNKSHLAKNNSSTKQEEKLENKLTKNKCEYCLKKFRRPSSLKTHLNIHTGIQPFKCPSKRCDKSFNARSNMLRHYKLHFKIGNNRYLLPNGEISSFKPTTKQLFSQYGISITGVYKETKEEMEESSENNDNNKKTKKMKSNKIEK